MNEILYWLPVYVVLVVVFCALWAVFVAINGDDD